MADTPDTLPAANPPSPESDRPLLWPFNLGRHIRKYRGFTTLPSFLDAEHCDEVIRLGEESLAQSGKSGVAGKGVNPDIRQSTITWLAPSRATRALYRRVERTTLAANDRFFHFSVIGMSEALQFARYGPDRDHYDWHQDIGDGPATLRKISIIVQLSPPDAYEGGDVELLISTRAARLPRDRGAAILFPSYQLHRVTPVTAGTRYSLVCWISGEPFR